jgi:tetratricopeptide (TPR) repeat protein
MGAGVAWGDFDNDGDDDLFLVGAGGPLTTALGGRAASVLYENLVESGRVAFRPSPAFPETRRQGMAAAWGDADGDGWLDLVLTGYNTLRLFRNEGGQLRPNEGLPDLPGFWAGAVWGDFDNDRDLDLYVCGYVQYVEDPSAGRRASEQYGTSVPYTLNPASFEPERNLLFENRSLPGGPPVFEEVAALWGVSNPEGRSLSALWRDFDEDGRLDLYVANDISDNALYLNRGDTFEDAGLAAWVADYRGAMGLAAGDWNRDGDEDLFVTHWIAQENALYDSRLADQPPVGSRRLTFSDLASPLGLGQIALQLVGWGTEFADLDSDGWLDLVVANGSTLEEPGREGGKRLKPQRSMVLWSEEGRHFHDLAPAVEALAEPRVGRGLAVSDFDRDGDLDLVVATLDGPPLLLANELANGHWLELRLRSRATGDPPGGPNRGFGDGSTAIVRSRGVALRRSVGGASYLSQSSRLLHFGLGASSRVEGVTVRWLGGEVQELGPLEADAIWEISEGDPTPRRLPSTAAPLPPESTSGGPETDERARLLAFWETQRAAMQALKQGDDCPAAIELFREALSLDPGHQDSRYYLANCLASLGRVEEALDELDTLRRADRGSHRGHKQWGLLRAITARGEAELLAAEEALERAHAINREETGALHLLGEIALVRGDFDLADQRLAWVCRTNPRAVGGFFLRAYLAWKGGDGASAHALLEAARSARGAEWKPAGAAAEGEVRVRMHREGSLLAAYWESWNGQAGELESAFAALEDHLEALRNQH